VLGLPPPPHATSNSSIQGVNRFSLFIVHTSRYRVFSNSFKNSSVDFGCSGLLFTSLEIATCLDLHSEMASARVNGMTGLARTGFSLPKQASRERRVEFERLPLEVVLLCHHFAGGCHPFRDCC
jgi:hypothetical protein